MANNTNKDRIEKLANLMEVWFSKSNFQESRKASELMQDLTNGPEKYIVPFMADDFREDASANWERLKTEFGLTTQTDRDKEIRDMEDKAARQHEQQFREMSSENYDVRGPQLLGNMSIKEALRAEWTGDERSPPPDSDHSDWLSPMNLALSDKLSQLVEYVAEEYSLNQQQATRRLHRFGTQELVRVINVDIVGGEASLEEYRNAGKRAGMFVSGVSHGYTTLGEKVEVETNFGTKPGAKQSYKIVWNQKDSIEFASSQLGISEADAFRWSLTIAGNELNQSDELPKALGNDLEEILNDVNQFAKEKAIKIKQSSKLAILEAFDSGYGPEVAQYCMRETPNMWNEFVSLIARTHDSLEAADPKRVFLAGEDGSEQGGIPHLHPSLSPRRVPPYIP